MKIEDIKPRNLIVGNVFDDFALSTENIDFDVEDLCSYVISDVTNYYWLNIESIWSRIGFIWDKMDEYGHFSSSNINFTIIPKIPDPHRIQNFHNTFVSLTNYVRLIDSGWISLKDPLLSTNSINMLYEYNIASAPAFKSTNMDDQYQLLFLGNDLINPNAYLYINRDCSNDAKKMFEVLPALRIDNNNKYINIPTTSIKSMAYRKSSEKYRDWSIIWQSKDAFDFKYILKDKEEGISFDTSNYSNNQMIVHINKDSNNVQNTDLNIQCTEYNLDSIFKSADNNDSFIIYYNVPRILQYKESYSSYAEYANDIKKQSNVITVNQRDGFIPIKIYPSYQRVLIEYDSTVINNRSIITYNDTSMLDSYYDNYLILDNDMQNNTFPIYNNSNNKYYFKNCQFINIEHPFTLDLTQINQPIQLFEIENIPSFNVIHMDSDVLERVKSSSVYDDYFVWFSINCSNYCNINLYTNQSYWVSDNIVPVIVLNNDVIYKDINTSSTIKYNFSQLRVIGITLHGEFETTYNDTEKYQSLSNKSIKIIYDENLSPGSDIILYLDTYALSRSRVDLQLVDENLTIEQIKTYNKCLINFFKDDPNPVAYKINTGAIIVKDIDYNNMIVSSSSSSDTSDTVTVKYFSFHGNMKINFNNTRALKLVQAILNNLYEDTTGEIGRLTINTAIYQQIDYSLIERAVNLNYEIIEQI